MSKVNENTVSSEDDFLFTFRAFRAIHDIELSKIYFNGHTQVLTDMGITNLNTTYPDWMFDENVYAILVIDNQGEAIGGIRVHVYSGQQSLPLIGALNYLDENIVDVLEKERKFGTGEACGLWNSKKAFGKGLSPLLCISAIALSRIISLKSIFCFSAPYTEKMIRSNGCVDVPGLQNNGRYPYPTDKFISIVLWNPNIQTLEFANPFNKSRIDDLSHKPNQITVEPGLRGPLKIDYQLRIV